MKKIIFILIWLGCITGVSCQAAVDSNIDSKTFTVDSNDIKKAVVGNTDFAFDLYGKLRVREPNGNLVFSPYSISSALAMTYAGARGDTEKQIAETLHFTLTKKCLHPAFGALQKHLIQDEKSHGYELLLANALWGQKGETILKEFLDLNKQFYDAGFTLLDFVNETEKSRQIINRWVEEKTKEKIRELIPLGGVNGLTVLVLTNAIYFKGEWKTKFERKDTERADFKIPDIGNVEIDMMHLKKEDFKYYEDEKMQALELPYKGNEISLVVFLPKETEGIKEFENTLTAEDLNVLLSKMEPWEVEVYFPKFKISWGTFVLNDTLTDLGMPDAFDEGKADFSGINGERGLWISDIFHKAFIEVNEEGTEAAAGTGSIISASIHKVFRADHPFIFIIKDNRTGSILFMGRLMNPAEES
jgi:serpin B